MRTIFHLDLDAFFVSVERILDPSLKGKPVIVGGDPKYGRGVVAACSYEARVYGLHSAMPIRTAYKLCPHGIYIHGSHGEYSRFSKAVKNILLQYAPIVQQASIDEFYGEYLVVGHVYIERKMTPLNLYVRSATAEQAELAVIDYGQAIRDLAYTNIFAGDLLLKNFGVTRHGRVIFYDYDELCRVTDCRFRDLPEPSDYEDEMRAQSWFYVADNDVFPETFINFLGFDEHLKKVFLDMHGEILEAGWWRQLQERLSEGDVVEVLPYHPHRVRVASSF